MDQNNNNTPPTTAQSSASFGSIPNTSESFGNVPHHSEGFRIVPNDAETFGAARANSERKEYCTLTVREVARMFEAAGVARTERSIVNWCRPNKTGMSRLDNYFDPNERKYFISPQSVELAIAEEQAKSNSDSHAAQALQDVRKDSEAPATPKAPAEPMDPGRVGKLETEILDLKILSKGKDLIIDQLRQERERFFEMLLDSSRKVGELETRLLQLEGPGARFMRDSNGE